MHAIRIHKTGSYEVLSHEEIEKPNKPQDKQVLIDVHYAGVNFIDCYFRSGLYATSLPATLGQDASGIVSDVGENVTLFKVGDRVAFYSPVGTYCEQVLVDESAVLQVPDTVGLDIACACIVQGLTGHYLTTDAYKIKQGDSVLVHAAAGGTGQFVVQMAKILGATTIVGVASTPQKMETAKELGCTHTLLAPNAAQVKAWTNGQGVNAVFDGVGKDTWESSLDSLKKRGMFVSFGNASGPVPPISLLELTKRGSLSVVRPSMKDYVATREELAARSNDIFKWIEQGKLKVSIHKVFPLADAAKAHAEIEGRGTLGKILLQVAKKL